MLIEYSENVATAPGTACADSDFSRNPLKSLARFSKPYGRLRDGATPRGAAPYAYFLTSGQAESASLPKASSPLIVLTSL
jgi:hypothetical protein